MKAYTDLEQSKKLAEILPIESADMKFPYFGDGQYGTTPCVGEPIEFSGGKDIPCWSLAALLEVLPCPSLDDTFGEWRCQCYKEDHIVATAYAYDPVGACVEMIYKLKEKELI